MKKLMILAVLFTMFFNLNCFAGEGTLQEVQIDESIMVDDSSLKIEKIAESVQLIDERIIEDGTIEKDYVVTSVYDIGIKQNECGIAPDATKTDSTDSIRMNLDTSVTRVTNSYGDLAKVTDFSVSYVKLDSQAVVTKIQVWEDSFGHIYDSTATNLIYPSRHWTKSLGSKSSGITPNYTYTINHFSGKSALSNYYVVLTDTVGYAGTKATFTINRNNSASVWTGSIESHIYLFSET